MSSRTPLLVCLVSLVSLLILAGCSGPEVRFQREGFSLESILTERVALGGFVLGTPADQDPMAETGESGLPATVRQSRAWTPHLETALRVQAPDLDRWSWASVADQIEPERLDAFLHLYARGSILTGQQLGPLASDLPGTRFLLLARLDQDELDLHSQEISTGNPGGQADTGSLYDTHWYQHREITVSLELYDLQLERSVWSASVERAGNQSLTADRGHAKPRIRVERDADAENGIRILGGGVVAEGPDLDGLLDDACQALVGELLAAAHPREPSGQDR